MAAVLAPARPSGAESAPTPSPVVKDRGPDASDGSVPAVSPVAKAPKPVIRGLRTVPTPPAGDKGSSYIDEGQGAPLAAPTELERLKLDRARQSVEAARAAGLLNGAVRPEARLALSPADLEEAKFRAAERWKTAPRTIVHHPQAGVGDGSPAVQLQGPQELSALERQKLEAFLRGETFAGPPLPPAKPVVEAPKVDSGRKVVKGGQ
jgi:hypothetical protein